MLGPIYFFNELRIRLGMRNALHIFYGLKIKKNGKLRVSYLQFPFSIRPKDGSDLATFKEVIVRKDYNLELAFDPKHIIDGGANIGLTSLFFANKYPAADIVAIEPDTANFRLLEENTSFYKQIRPVHSGIWSNNSLLKIVDHGRGTDGYTVEEAPESEKNTFRAVSIPGIMKENNWDTIDVLKLDVEGSEKEIFSNGYESWLPKTRVLIIEIHDRFVAGCSHAVFATISKYNFSCTIKGFNMIFTNQDWPLI